VAHVEEATVRPGDPPGEICLVAGAELRVTYAPGDWRPVDVSDPAVLACAAAEPGAVCRAARAGTAVLSASAGADSWRLTVHVVPPGERSLSS
jgi:hypothetical protein